jgi:sarcosine oxidase, subunit delta
MSSQSDKGEMVIGGGLDLYDSYAQRGNLPIGRARDGRLPRALPDDVARALMRQWARHDRRGPRFQPDHRRRAGARLWLNCGWGTGGFKAIPAGGWTFAHTIATGITASACRRVRPRSLRHGRARRRGRGLGDRALMLLIACPLAASATSGVHLRRPRHIARPGPPDEVGDAQWARYLFERDNPKGLHYERWLHRHGCGQWFNVARDTVTHEIKAVYGPLERKPELP